MSAVTETPLEIACYRATPHGVGAVAVVELVVFMAILTAALAYIWRKRALEWR